MRRAVVFGLALLALASCSSHPRPAARSAGATPSFQINPSDPVATTTGPIPVGQCTASDALLAQQYAGWEAAGNPIPSPTWSLLLNDVTPAVDEDAASEHGAIDDLDAQELQAAATAVSQDIPNPGLNPGGPSPTPAPSYASDLAAFEADLAWWTDCEP